MASEGLLFAVTAIGVALVLPVGRYVLERRRAARAWADAMEERCLLCDEAVTGVPYTCGHCGYRSEMATEPATAELLAIYQEMKIAVDAYDRAERLRREAESLARSPAREARARAEALFADADREEMEAVALLDRAVRLAPELHGDVLDTMDNARSAAAVSAAMSSLRDLILAAGAAS